MNQTKILYRENSYIIAGLLFFSAFVLYVTTVCPSIYWRDAAEFQVVAFQLGIAHPAGSPFYALIAKLFTFLPFGSIAFKVNLVSAFSGALLIPLTLLFICEIILLLFPQRNKGFLILSAALAVSFYAVADSLWYNSIVAEVYTLQNCCIVLIALCLVRALRLEQKSYLYAAGLLFGLSTGAHIIMILYIPALLLFLGLIFRRSLTWPHFGTLVLFVMLGTSVYLYLPVRSSVNPYYDWGNPETAENFYTHVTDKKDAGSHFNFSSRRFFRKLKTYGGYYDEDFEVVGILLGLTGLIIFFKRKPKLFFLFAFFFYSQWFFFIRYWPWSSAFIATFIFFTVGIGIALFAAMEGIKTLSICSSRYRTRIAGVAIAAVCLLCLMQVFFLSIPHWQKNARSQYWSPYCFFDFLFAEIPYRGVLVNSILYFGISYLQQAENMRPDITNLFLSEIISPEVFNYVTTDRYPLITIPTVSGIRLGEAIIRRNIRNHDFYWEPLGTKNRYVKNNLKPHGMLMRITPSPQPLSPEDLNTHAMKFEHFLHQYNPAFYACRDPEENELYVSLIEGIAKYFYDRQEYETAIRHLLVANKLKPKMITVLNALACAHANLGLLSKAQEYLAIADKEAPSNPTTLQNLGRLWLDRNNYEMALYYYKKCLAVDPSRAEVYYWAGQCYENIGDARAAREAYTAFLRIAPEDSFAEKARERLDTLNTQNEPPTQKISRFSQHPNNNV